MLTKSAKTVQMKDLPVLTNKDIKKEIEKILGLLKQKGYEVIVIDLTHRELKIPVVRMFVPGCRCILGLELDNPYFFLAETYFEAGNKKKSEEYFKKFKFRSPYLTPESAALKVAQVLKPDYRENIKAWGGLKKSAVDYLREREGELKGKLI
jgi:Asp-tRNA(Asn)/Glu-tRNA(Gln) amidotransferase A subunit family amidase